MPWPAAIGVNISMDQQALHYWGPSKYANRTVRLWPLAFSQNVDAVSFNFAKFQLGTYNDDDTWSLHHEGGTSLRGREMNGQLGWWGAYYTKHNAAHTHSYVELGWNSGVYGDNGEGYKIGQLGVACVSNPSQADNTLYLMRNTPYDAVLLEQGDVIYAWTRQPKDHEMVIVLWPIDLEPSSDFDLFIGLSTAKKKPSFYSNDGSSTRGVDPLTGVTYPELVHLDPPASDRDVFISAGAYSGRGHFRLYANVLSKNHPKQYNVVTDWYPSTADKLQIKRNLRKLSQAIHWATDGRNLIKRWDVYWNTPYYNYLKPFARFTEGQTSNQCFFSGPTWTGPADHLNWTAINWCGCNRDPATGGNPSCPCTTSQDFYDRWGSETGLHEMSHCLYFVDDETLGQTSAGGCGHSLMPGAGKAYNAHTVDYCDSLNGGKDYDPPTWFGHDVALNQWAHLESTWPSVPAKNPLQTPDAFYATGTVGSFYEPYDDQPFRTLIQIVEHEP